MTSLRTLLLFLAVIAPASAQSRGIRFSDTQIVGKIQKPEIQIFITKQNLTPKYELDLRESFLPRVVESVEQKPF